MTNALQLRFRGSVINRSEASSLLKSPGDAVLVERGRPRLLMLACPCGCGEEFPVNLDPRAGPAWRLYQDRRNRLTVFPSVWREGGCNSHYIIWSDSIYLFGDDYDTFGDSVPSDELSSLAMAVQDRLPRGGLVSFADLAEALNAIPWDVLTACRRLVKSGLAREGSGKQRGRFGLT
jgi:Family of unknown function (DUF6527)